MHAHFPSSEQWCWVMLSCGGHGWKVHFFEARSACSQREWWSMISGKHEVWQSWAESEFLKVRSACSQLEWGATIMRNIGAWQPREESVVSKACGLQCVVNLHANMVNVRDHGLPNVYKEIVYFHLCV